jgi:hypothetical protein
VPVTTKYPAPSVEPVSWWHLPRIESIPPQRRAEFLKGFGGPA